MTVKRVRKPVWLIGWFVLLATTSAVAQPGGDGSAKDRWDAYVHTLTAAGEPLTMAALAARRPTLPPNRNGVVVMERLGKALDTIAAEPAPDVPFFELGLRSFDPSSGVPSNLIGPMRDFLKGHPVAVEGLHELERFDDGCLSSDWYRMPSDNPMDVAPSTIGRWEVAARLLRLEGLADIVAKRLEPVAAAVGNQFRLAATLRHESDSAVWTVRLAVLDGAVSAAETLLRAGAVERSTLDGLASLVDINVKSLSLADVLRFDRLYLMRVFDALISGKLALKNLVGEETLSQMGDVTQDDLYDAKLAVTKLWTNFIEIADDPVALLDRAQEEASKATPDTMTPKRFYLVGIHTYTLRGDAGMNARAQARLRCARVALAAEHHRLAQGTWPQSLEPLKAGLPAAALIDPFNGEPLRMIERDGGLVVYSVGPNKSDDKAVLTVPEGEYDAPDIGFVLESPAKRGPVAVTSGSGQ